MGEAVWQYLVERLDDMQRRLCNPISHIQFNEFSLFIQGVPSFEKWLRCVCIYANTSITIYDVVTLDEKNLNNICGSVIENVVQSTANKDDNDKGGDCTEGRDDSKQETEDVNDVGTQIVLVMLKEKVLLPHLQLRKSGQFERGKKLLCKEDGHHPRATIVGHVLTIRLLELYLTALMLAIELKLVKDIRVKCGKFKKGGKTWKMELPKLERRHICVDFLEGLINVVPNCGPSDDALSTTCEHHPYPDFMYGTRSMQAQVLCPVPYEKV
ncbi:hypothetical protein Cgig2_029602 [Carnegiea gigantea]|uniref:Uncharacterized protein n=1 Tax=Carnegiea gigantea TaxID=171969 RepID=A0A9Q1Q6D6_9CARY|nr:hypothetical protein Cgig2_029602 [Carnegiea gigantea]